MSHFHIRLYVFGILLVFLTRADADIRYSQGRNVGSGYAVYDLGLPDCAYEVTLKVKSYAHTDEGGYAGFSEPGGRRDGGLKFSMICRKAEQRNYCDTAWREATVDTDPDAIKITKPKFYKSVFKAQKAIILSQNMGAVNEPRPRAINFCLDLGNRYIDGTVWIGNELHDREKEALRILRTLEIK